MAPAIPVPRALSARAPATAPMAIPAAAAPLVLLPRCFWTGCTPPETMPLETDTLPPFEPIAPKPPGLIGAGPLGGRRPLAAPTIASRRSDLVPAPTTVVLDAGPPIDTPLPGPPAPWLGKPDIKFPPDPPTTCVCACHDDEDCLEALTVTWDTPPGTWLTGCGP